MKIGVTERGDASIDFGWCEKMDTVDGAIIITKNLTDKFIEKALEYKDKIIIHATCSGMGETKYEPNIPRFNEQLKQAQKLVELGFPKEKIVVRVDPIIPHINYLAENVIDMAAKMGFSRFRVSIIDMYPHARKRFTEETLPLPYGYYFSPSKTDINNVDNMLIKMKNKYPHIVVECCAEPNMKAAEQIGCLSKKDFTLLHLEYPENSAVGFQRKGCLCCSAKTELLSEKQRCPYKCAYCYWTD